MERGADTDRTPSPGDYVVGALCWVGIPAAFWTTIYFLL